MKKFFLILIITILSACSNTSNTPQMVTKSLIENMYKGDSQAILKIISNDSKNKDTIENITNASEAAKISANEKGGISSIVINDIQYNEDKTKASVHFIVTFKKGDVEDIGEIEAVKINDEWKISIPEGN